MDRSVDNPLWCDRRRPHRAQCTLGPAIAFHFAWNFYAIVLFGFPDYLGGLAFFTYDFSIMDEERLISLMPYDAAFLLLAYLTVRIALRR